ncbi:MAG TPA: hypothetical protein VFY04_08690, partial [Solirubrobacterales bacterium]|nr:hypothetical protein [Solirubrobacterales bacterium]
TGTSPKGAHFTHNGEPVTQNTPVQFTGTAAFKAGGSGVHCTTVHIHAVLKAKGTGTVTKFEGTHCTTTGANPGLPTHATPEGLPWTIDAAPGGVATINNVKIHNSVRHPLDTTIEIGTNTLTGEASAEIGGTDAILNVGPNGILVNHEVEAEVEGTLTITKTGTEEHTDIGTAATP